MNFNNKEYPITYVEANYNYFITIKSNDDISISFGFNLKKLDINSIKLNETINLIPYIHWDITLVTKEDKYVFDISNNKVELTKLDDNKYELYVDVKDPDMIIPGNTFDNFSLKAELSFEFDYKPKPDKSILEKGSTENQPNLFTVLDKLNKINNRKIVIAGSAIFYKEALELKDELEHKKYIVLDYPKKIDVSNKYEYKNAYESFYKNLSKTDDIILFNLDKNNIEGYIGYESFAELSYLIVKKLEDGLNHKIYIYKMPSEEVGCYDEIKQFLDLGYIEIYK